MDVPENTQEEAIFNGTGLPTKEDESFIVFGDDLTGLTPNMHAIQKLLNEKLGLDPYSNDVPKDY